MNCSNHISIIRTTGLLLSLLVLLLPLEQADAVIELQSDAVVRIHAINGSDSSGPISTEPTVGSPRVNLRVHGQFDHGLKAYSEIYLGERPSENAPLEIGSLYGSTGSAIPWFRVKLGKFEVPFGTQLNYRSDHAQVQNNPLIGNPLVDPNDHQLGGEIFGTKNRLTWSVALTNGTDRSTVNPDRGFGSSLRFSVDLLPEDVVELTVSGYRSYHGDTRANRTTSSVTTDNLFGTNDKLVSGQTLQALQSGRQTPYPHIKSGLGYQPESLTIGRDLMAWQADLEVRTIGLWRIRFGQLEDDLSNLGWTVPGRPSTVKWEYYSLEGMYPLADLGYLAWRWGTLNAKHLDNVPRIGRGVSRNGEFERFQIGVGRQVSNNLRIKLEYVSGDETITNDQFTFDGLSFEASLTGFPKISPKNLNLSKRNQTSP
jgi:hypothetical protein